MERTRHDIAGYKPAWGSLRQYLVPKWFKDAKLGIFIHWGVYSVPAFNWEWYPNRMYIKGKPEFEHHLAKYGPHSRFGYKDFIPMFRAERWDPQAWVALFKRAGARYVVPVAEHHDGFAMYDSACTEWNSARMGPKVDVVARLKKTARAEGMKFGVSSHRATNWRYFPHSDEFDTADPRYAGLYGQPHAEGAPPSREFLEDWLSRTKELIDRFEPDILYFDSDLGKEGFVPYLPEVVAYYYNQALRLGKEVVLNYKDGIPDGVAVYDIERGGLDRIREQYWQTDTSVSNRSWGYIEGDVFKTPATLVHTLADAVSKNGNLLLNVGPRADGTIPQEAEDILRGIGSWLDVNGEAIYGTRPWDIFGEGPTQVGEGKMSEGRDISFTADDIRFTTKDNNLYAICMGWPGDEIVIRSLNPRSSVRAGNISRVSMLGSEEELLWSQTEDGLRIGTPHERPCEHAYAFKVSRTA